MEIPGNKIPVPKKIVKRGGSINISSRSLIHSFNQSKGIGVLHAATSVGKNRSPNYMSYNLLSLADYPSISTVVYLDRLKFQKSASKWKLIESFASSNSPFAIELESGESLVDLAPLIGGAGSFAVYGGLATKAFAGKMAYIFNTRHLLRSSIVKSPFSWRVLKRSVAP